MKNILKTLNKAIILYDEHLNDNEFIFIFYNDLKKLEYKKIKFVKNNFLHLTGIKTNLSPKDFYKFLKKDRLKEKDINIKDNGTTRLKLDIVDQMHHLIYTPTVIGDYDGFTKIKLDVDSVLGNTKANGICIGLKNIKPNNYAPKSLLKENIKHITHKTNSVLLTLKKNCSNKEFNIVTYKSKKIDIEKFVEINSEFLKDLNISIDITDKNHKQNNKKYQIKGHSN